MENLYATQMAYQVAIIMRKFVCESSGRSKETAKIINSNKHTEVQKT